MGWEYEIMLDSENKVKFDIKYKSYDVANTDWEKPSFAVLIIKGTYSGWGLFVYNFFFIPNLINQQYKNLLNQDKKEEIWPSPMTKASSYTNRNVKRASDNTNNATKKFD